MVGFPCTCECPAGFVAMLDPHRHPAADEPAVEADGRACKPAYDEELWGVDNFPALARMVLAGVRSVGVSNPADQDDLVSEGLFKAWRSRWLQGLHGRLPPDQFHRALCMVLKRAGISVARDLRRRGKRKMRDLAKECSIDDVMLSCEDRDVGGFDVHHHLDAALSRLPSRDHETIVFCDLVGLSHAEVAARIHAQADQVTTIRRRALVKLRRFLPASLQNDL